jgi:hypothetical protein
MSLESRLAKLEDQVDSHLMESGEVREAIKDLKKSVDTISSRMWAAMVGSVSSLICLVGFLLKVTIWR